MRKIRIMSSGIDPEINPVPSVSGFDIITTQQWQRSRKEFGMTIVIQALEGT